MSDQPEQPQYLDLDALASAAPDAGIKLGGKFHPMVPVTVEGFIANLQLVQDLQDFIKTAENAAEVAAKNLHVACSTLHRAYPSIAYEDFKAMPMEHLNAITEYTQRFDGTKKAQEAAAREAQENPLLQPPPASTPTTTG